MNTDTENQSETDLSQVSFGKNDTMQPDNRIFNYKNYKIYNNHSCRLERQDGERNRNKFYILQVLQKEGRFYVYSRWGKKGQGGQQRMSAPIMDVNQAVGMFEKRFREKTGVEWDARANLDAYTEMYRIYENDLSLKSVRQKGSRKSSQEEEKKQQKGRKGEEEEEEEEELPRSAHDLPSKQLMQEKDPFEKAGVILKDVCYEINVLKSDKTNEIIKKLSDELLKTCPDAFGRNKPSLDSNDGIRQTLSILSDYKKKQRESRQQEE